MDDLTLKAKVLLKMMELQRVEVAVKLVKVEVDLASPLSRKLFMTSVVSCSSLLSSSSVGLKESRQFKILLNPFLSSLYLLAGVGLICSSLET